MRLNYLLVKPLLPLAALLLLAACHDDDKPEPEHEGEGQLIVTVENPGNQALTLRLFGEGLEKPLESRFEAEDATGVLDAWLPTGQYDALLTGGTKEIGIGDTGSFSTATATVRIPEGASTLPALDSPVYMAVRSGITLTEGEKKELTLQPKDMRKQVRLTVTTSDGLSTGPLETTLGGIAREINLATGNITSFATLGLTLPAPDAQHTSRATFGILGVANDTHLLTCTWQAADGKKGSYSENVSEQLHRAIEAGADTIDLAVVIREEATNVPIHLYTGIKTRAMIDEFQQTPVCIAVGTVAGQYTENWDGTATEGEIKLSPERYYPADGSPVFLRGYHPAAPLTNGEVKYTLTGQEDLMLSIEQNGSLTNRFSAATTPLTYSHLLSQLNFTLRLKGAPKSYRVRSVHLNGMAASAVVNLFSGKVEPSGFSGPVVVYSDPGTGGFPVVDGVVTLPGYVLVQPEASLTLDLVLAVDNNPAHDRPFKNLPIRFGEGGTEGGSAYEIEISLEVPDNPDPDPTPDPDPDPDPTPDPDPDPDPTPDPDPGVENAVKVTVTARVITWGKGESGGVIV